MSDDSAYPPPYDVCGVWEDMNRRGYALTTDKALGLPVKFRENFEQTYFNDAVLRHDAGDWPVDRKRARDVIHYEWHDGRLELREFETITITDRAGFAGKREHARIRLLADPQARELVEAFLSMVPPARRKSVGTFGVNLFRTHTDVVTAPHRDNEEFIILYVLNRVGDGAETYLYDDDAGPGSGVAQQAARPALTKQLNPGDLVIFEDTRFRHGATPLQAPPGRTAMRDALVCSVDYESTYLAAAASA
jgi:hypothetical protein